MLPQLAYHDPNLISIKRKPRIAPPVHVNNISEVDLMEFRDIDPEKNLLDEASENFDDYLFQVRSRPRANTTPRPQNQAEPNLNNVRNKANDRCYRCGEVGHYADTCVKPRRIFCRDCGTKGVRRTECQTCPPIKQVDFCKNCGLVGVTTEKCTECSGN